ncbi:MAG: hypothetical protein ACXIUZ_01965 [Lysobacteraceae bacterium]
MSLNILPHSAAELIAVLDKLYPVRCIRPGEDLNEAHRYAGCRELVDKLIQAQKRTDSQALANAMRSP